MAPATLRPANPGRGRAIVRVICFSLTAVAVTLGIVFRAPPWLLVALVSGWIGGALRYQSPLSRPRSGGQDASSTSADRDV